MVPRQQHFVLVHGAGHGAWCWIKVVPLLEKAGHRVTTVDLASAGENTEIPDDVKSLEQYSRPLEDLLKSLPDDEKVILAGHSLGGMSLTVMSETFSKKILVAVYLTALMPAPGVDLGFISATDPEFMPPTEGVPAQLLFYSKVKGGPITSMGFPVDRLKLAFYNKCSAEDMAFALERIKRFPMLTALLKPVPSTVENNYRTVPRVYVLCLRDGAVSEATARKIIALNPPNETYEIDADHSLFFSAVEEVERILVDVAAKYSFRSKAN